MGIHFAVDELYATGWNPLDSTGCAHTADGRLVPSVDRVRRECAGLGYTLELSHVQLFDCYRAAWSRAGEPGHEGAVVGSSEHEAAVYALAQLRRAPATASA